MKEIVTVQRQTKNSIDQKGLVAQLTRFADIALKGGRGRGWTYKLGKIYQKEVGDTWIYQAIITFSTTSARASLKDKFPRIIERFARAGCAGNLRQLPWVVIQPQGYTQIAGDAKVASEKAEDLRKKSDEPKELGAVTLNIGDHFNRLYGREPHIRRIIDALELAVHTNYEKRNHSLLAGSPGCGKSEIMTGLSKMLGQEGESWLWFDATSMTRAGAIEELMNAPKVPPVLFIEEIEKCEEQALRFLLGIMDHRGQIRRTNYRVGNQCRHVRMVIIATANDVRLLESIMAGALYSRFQNRIYCDPPTRQIMHQILEREINEIKGDVRWIEPALKFGFDKWNMTDPRNLITICTCGGKRLLTGEYQKDFEATMHPEERNVLLNRQKK